MAVYYKSRMKVATPEPPWRLPASPIVERICVCTRRSRRQDDVDDYFADDDADEDIKTISKQVSKEQIAKSEELASEIWEKLKEKLDD